MDWIEEFSQNIRRRIDRTSLYKGLVYQILLCLAGAVALNLVTRSLCLGWIVVIAQRYMDVGSFDDVVNATRMVNIPILTRFQPDIPFVPAVELMILQFLYQNGLVVYLLIAEYFGIKSYFKGRVGRGIAAAREAVDYLVMGDYSHEQEYYEKNELAAICNEVELLRKQMISEKEKEWDAQLEQSSVNAAFAHDLRTPLTVMKGYTEFLIKYIPAGKVSEEMLLEKLQTIHQHEDRLLEFSTTMNQIQKMELRPLHCEWITWQELCSIIEQTTNELEKQSGKRIHFFRKQGESFEENSRFEETRNHRGELQRISLDKSLVLEVCENLLSNALRYAACKVEIELVLEQELLILYVRDDGTGFSTRALREAKTLYFSEEKGEDHHFGMGLYICDQLCMKHGGRLNLLNGVEGGAIFAAEFRVIDKRQGGT